MAKDQDPMTRRPRRRGAAPSTAATRGATVPAVDGADVEPSRPPAATALLQAATELFSERSPTSVSLRQVAERAGVNYGLIHHYFGTKEALLSEVFRASSERGIRLLANAPTIEAALRSIAPHQGPGSYLHMLAWVILDGATHRLEPAAEVDRLSELVEEDWRAAGLDPEEAPFDSRAVVVAAMAALNGWRFFEPFFQVVGGLDQLDDDMSTQDVVTLILAMVRAAGVPAPQP